MPGDIRNIRVVGHLSDDEYNVMFGRKSPIRMWAREAGVEDRLCPPPAVVDDATLKGKRDEKHSCQHMRRKQR